MGTWNNTVGMYRNQNLPSLTRRIGISLLIGLIIAVIGGVVQAVLGNNALLSIDAVDDFIIGILAGIVIFIYEQRRYRATMDKIQMISAMNHHVRNALQTISYAPYTEQEKQIRMIAESVGRIEWALREILPGEAPPDGSLPSGSTRTTASAGPR
jgi:hypothetical protein